MVDAQKWRVRQVGGTISAPFKVTRRFESSWSDAVRTHGTNESFIRSTEKSLCPAESVDEEMCSSRTLVEFL